MLAAAYNPDRMRSYLTKTKNHSPDVAELFLKTLRSLLLGNAVDSVDHTHFHNLVNLSLDLREFDPKVRLMRLGELEQLGTKQSIQMSTADHEFSQKDIQLLDTVGIGGVTEVVFE